MDVVTNQQALGWQYHVEPDTVGVIANYPPANAQPAGQLMRFDTVAVRLPWTPVSYPSVGAAPRLGAAAAPAAAIAGNTPGVTRPPRRG